VGIHDFHRLRSQSFNATWVFRYPDNRITFVARYRYFVGDDRHFIRSVSTVASGPISKAAFGNRKKEEKKKMKNKEKIGKQEPKDNTRTESI